jgi:hypothetical protein
MDANQASLIALVADLPEAIGQQFETGLTAWSTAAATNH